MYFMEATRRPVNRFCTPCAASPFCGLVNGSFSMLEHAGGACNCQGAQVAQRHGDYVCTVWLQQLFISKAANSLKCPPQRVCQNTTREEQTALTLSLAPRDFMSGTETKG